MSSNTNPVGLASFENSVNQNFTVQSCFDLINSNTLTPTALPFLSAVYNGTTITLTQSLSGQPLAAPMVFDFSTLSPDRKTQLQSLIQTATQNIPAKVQNPNDHNSPDIQLQCIQTDTFGNQTSSPATLFDIISKPQAQFSAYTTCNGSIDNPNWASNLSDYYDDSGLWHGATFCSNESGTGFTTSAGLQVTSEKESNYHGGGQNFTAVGSGSDWSKYVTF